MNHNRLLIVEGNQDELQVLQAIFQVADRPKFEIKTTACQQSGLSLAISWKPDVFILGTDDLPVPNFSIVEKIHQYSPNTKVCLLSTNADLEVKLASYQAGSDEYFVKPYSPRELVTKVQILSRRGRLFGGRFLTFSHITIDTETRVASISEKLVKLTTKECILLVYLMKRPDQVISRDELLDRVWEGQSRYPNTVDAYIERLRQKIGRPFNTTFIQTAYGQGYFFNSQVILWD